MEDYGEKRFKEGEFEQLFKEMDADEDGQINFTDFVRSMMMR